MGGWFGLTTPTLLLGLGLVLGIGIAITAGILALDGQRRRDQRAAALQDLLAAPITRELGQAGVSVLPTVRIPLFKAATRPAVIQITGHVPSRELRDRVIHLVEREGARLRYFRIEDRMRISRPRDSERRRLA
jgi:hypothetical protein